MNLKICSLSISSTVAENKSGTSSDFIKKIWSITDQQAEDIVKANTQLNCQTSEGLLSRHFLTNNRMLQYCRIQSYFFTDMLHVTSKAKSLHQYKHLQVFVSDKGLWWFILLRKGLILRIHVTSFVKKWVHLYLLLWILLVSRLLEPLDDSAIKLESLYKS